LSPISLKSFARILMRLLMEVKCQRLPSAPSMTMELTGSVSRNWRNAVSAIVSVAPLFKPKLLAVIHVGAAAAQPTIMPPHRNLVAFRNCEDARDLVLTTRKRMMNRMIRKSAAGSRSASLGVALWVVPVSIPSVFPHGVL